VRWSGIYDQLRALDAAIDLFEAESANNLSRRQLSSQVGRTQARRPSSETHSSGGEPATAPIVNHRDAPLQASSFAQSAIAGEQILSLPTLPARGGYSATVVAGQRLRRALWSTFQLMLAAVLRVALYVAFESYIAFFGSNTTLWTEETAKNTGVSFLSTNLLRAETKNPLVGRASSKSESKLRPATSQNAGS
jgi:hypothetical protein